MEQHGAVTTGGWTPGDDRLTSTDDVERTGGRLPLAAGLVVVAAIGLAGGLRLRSADRPGEETAGPPPSPETILIPDETDDGDGPVPETVTTDRPRTAEEVTLNSPVLLVSDRIELVEPDGTRTDLGPTGPGSPDRAMVVGRGQAVEERQTVALLWRADGSAPVTSVALDPPGLRSEMAPRGTVVPSSAGGRYWLVTEGILGGPVVGERDVFGRATTRSFEPPGRVVADSGRGLVIERRDDTVIWNPFTGAVDSVGRADAFVATDAGRVVRCPGRCDELYVLGGPLPDVLTTVELPGAWDMAGTRGLLNGSASWLAAPVVVSGVPRLGVVEIRTGEVGSFDLPVESAAHLSWAGEVLVVVAGGRVMAIDPRREMIGVVATGLESDIVSIAVMSGSMSSTSALLWGVDELSCCGGSVAAARPGEVVWPRPDGSLARVDVAGDPFDVIDVPGGRRAQFLVRDADGRTAAALWSAAEGRDPESTPLPAAPMDLATDGTRVAALLEDGTIWLDGAVLAGPAGGRAVELVDGAPWVLAGDGRMWRAADGERALEPIGDLHLGGLLDVVAAAGRLWVLDSAGVVLVVQPDGSSLRRLDAPAQGIRSLAVDGSRVLAVSADGAVRALHLEQPAEVIARVALDRPDGPVVDAVVADGELWYVTEAGAVRRQALGG
jgi:hypothetical protein